MKVKNVNGIINGTCKCGSSLNHWKNFSEQALPKFCPEWGCLEKPEVGAHVQKNYSADTSWYTIPLCKEHSEQTGKSLVIDDCLKLVPANVCVIYACNQNLSNSQKVNAFVETPLKPGETTTPRCIR